MKNILTIKNRFAIVILIWIFPFYSNAQQKDSLQSSKLIFDLPIFDFPYQLDAAKTVNGGLASPGSFLKGYSNPSMHQSISVSSDLYTGMHFGINQLFNVSNKKRRDWSLGKRILYSLTLCGSDFLMLYAPGFDGWEHEEFHRAVLTRFHVNSFNDMNKFPLGAELINVSHVTDESLIRFKQESPFDFIRSHEAGIEGEYLLIDRLQRNNFFYNQNLPHEFIYLLSTFNSVSYVVTCADPKEADKMTDEESSKEKNMAVRDFTGLDFLAWTYDLFRPNEPYTNRGIHRSGIGIDRYIKTSDLKPEELTYLKKQGNLQWLNVISPMLFGFKRIKLSESGLYGNFSVRHFLTSFGNDISCNVYLMNSKYKLQVAYHSFQNYQHTFPAIEAQLIDIKQVVCDRLVYFSPRIFVGLQPLNQEFKTESSSFLGLAECKVELRSKRVINPFIELSAKSKGWIAGNEFLTSNFSCRFGITYEFARKK